MTGDSGNGKRILVVDDEPSIVDAVLTALRYEGYEVDGGVDGPRGPRSGRDREP